MLITHITRTVKPGSRRLIGYDVALRMLRFRVRVPAGASSFLRFFFSSLLLFLPIPRPPRFLLLGGGGGGDGGGGS